jgi:hypothetical protein
VTMLLAISNLDKFGPAWEAEPIDSRDHATLYEPTPAEAEWHSGYALGWAGVEYLDAVPLPPIGRDYHRAWAIREFRAKGYLEGAWERTDYEGWLKALSQPGVATILTPPGEAVDPEALARKRLAEDRAILDAAASRRKALLSRDTPGKPEDSWHPSELVEAASHDGHRG